MAARNKRPPKKKAAKKPKKTNPILHLPDTSKAKTMPYPEKGTRPRKIGYGMGSPGGAYTPGAKAKAKNKAKRRKK
jgi:hypothetical protein